MLGKLARNTVVASALSLPALALAVPEAMAGKNDFYVYNNSSSDIYYLYVSEASSSDWQNDILGEQILYSGQNVQVYFGNPNPNVCYYDFRAELSSGQVIEDYQVDVCTNDYYQIYDQ
jgi:hypothetical protein